MKKLSIGLLVDKPNTNKYVYELIKWSKQQENLNIDCLIIQKKINLNKIYLEKLLILLIKMG